MKYEDLKSKINALHVSLTEKLEVRYDSFINFQNDIIKKIINHELSEKDGLYQLETSLLQLEEEKNQHISSLKTIVTNLKDELNQVIIKFEEENSSLIDKEKIASQKETNFNTLTAPKRKEIETLKQKINTLDRECLLNLKAKALEYEEEEKNYKAKINDLDKRLRYEIQKISDAILIPMKANNENTDNRAITDQNELQEYRIKGINEIANLKVKYYNDLKQIDINFYRYHYDFHRDSDVLREQYNQRIEELNYAIKKIEAELQVMLDTNNIETFKQLSQNERDYYLARNNIKRDYQNKWTLYQDNIIKADYEKADIRDENVNTILEKINEIDLKQLDNLNFTSDYLDFVFLEVRSSLSQLLDTYLNLIINLINGYTEKYHHFLNQFMSHFAMSNYHSLILNDYTYQSHHELLLNIVNDYIILSQQKLKQFINLINKCFKDINLKVNELYNLYLQYSKSSQADYQLLQQNLKRLFSQAAKEGKSKQNHDKILKTIELNQNEYHIENVNTIKKLIEEDNLTFTKYKEANEVLNRNTENIKRQKEELFIKLKNNHEQNLANSKENIKRIIIKYKNKIKNKEKQINQKYDNEINKVEADRKAKIKISLT